MARYVLPLQESQFAFRREVEEKSHQAVSVCYQCGKCTAGCPVAFEMDVLPHQIMRGLQLGMKDKVLLSRTIWLCAACETCSTRCPQEVDIAGVMDALRQIAYAQKIKTAENDVPLFHRIFLSGVKQHARQFEAGMILFYNLRSGHYLKDVDMAPTMLLKGRLSLLPPRPKNAKELKEMFARIREMEAEAR